MDIVYISGPLTGIDKSHLLKDFYEDVGKLCREFDMMPYIPHQHTDPERHPKVTPKKVFIKDKKQIMKSKLVIAYVGAPSLGVGAELAIAEANNVPIILLYEKERRISRMTKGTSTVIAKIAFIDLDDALRKLRKILSKEYFQLHFGQEVDKKGYKQLVLRSHQCT